MANKPNLTYALGNRLATTLDGSITNSATTINVVDASGFKAAGGYGIIDEENEATREIVYVESVSSNVLTIATNGRGLCGTVAVAHASGVSFKDIIVDDHINGITDQFKVGHSDAGAHVLPNNTALSIKESGGTARDIIKVTSGDIVQVGYNTLPIQTIGKNDGWNSIGDTWAYASATTITVPAGAATYYAVGDKIKLTQTTVKYFYVVGVADTVLTVTGGTDYTVADAAITAIYHSRVESPIGFPGYFNYTPTLTGWASTTILQGRFTVIAKSVQLDILITGTSNATSAEATLPITALTLSNARWGGALDYSRDNGTYLSTATRWTIASAGTAVKFYKDMVEVAWTNSGAKEISATMRYSIA